MSPSAIELEVVPDTDEPDCAEVFVRGRVAGRPYRFLLDTGAAISRLPADELTGLLPDLRRDSSHGVFGAAGHDVVRIRDLVVGTMSAPVLDVARGGSALLGMDVLGAYALQFRFSASLLEPAAAAPRPPRNLFVDGRGHPYVEVEIGGLVAAGVWDTGAGITVVDEAFRQRHADLFQPLGRSVGTDAGGRSQCSDDYRIAPYVVGGVRFDPHRVAAVDLSDANRTVERRIDLILGYPTLAQADWWFDFPARAWAVTRPSSTR